MFKKIIESIQKAQMRRVAFWQLANMTDKELHDIGVARGDIRRIVYEDWGGKTTPSSLLGSGY